MPAGLAAAIIFIGILLLIQPVVFHRLSLNSEPREFGAPTLSDDEISYAISELSMDDLEAFGQLIDAFSEHELQMNGDQGQDSLGGKPKNSRSTPDNDENMQITDVDEEYVKQLDESFPNVDDEDDGEKAHVRVKRM